MRQIIALILPIFLLGGWTSFNSSPPITGCGATVPVSSYIAPSTRLQNDIAPLCLANPAGDTVGSNKNWTGAFTNYLAAPSNGAFVLNTLSSGYARDVEMTTWTHRGVVYLRLDGNGNAIYFNHNGDTANGTLEIGIATGVGQSSFLQGNYYALYQNADLVHTISGYTLTNTDGQTFTFGVQGFTIYVKYNGVQVISFQDYRQMSAGAVALQSLGGGFRDITITPFGNQFLYSNYGYNQLDLRDFGLRSVATTGTVSATTTASFSGTFSGKSLTVSGVSGTIAIGQKISGGTSSCVLADTIITSGSGTSWTVSNPQGTCSGAMTSGSTTLTIASNQNFNVNDYVIVEIGAEAGAGQRGTIGVGGQWPALTYANQAAMFADTSQPTGIWGWRQSDGANWEWANQAPWNNGPSDTLTVSSYTYNSGNGHVVLTMSNFVVGPVAGDMLTVSGLTPSSFNETVTVTATNSGCAGTGTICYTTATGRAAPTGTASAIVGWSTSPVCSCSYTYYVQKAVPMSLLARITGIAGGGTILTLDTAAATTATNANVYFDNQLVLNDLFQAPRGQLTAITPTNLTVSFPAGTYHLGAKSLLNLHSGWVISGQGQGQTILKAPKGTIGAALVANSSSVTVQDFTLVGNVDLNGYGMNWQTTVVPIPSSAQSTEYDPAGKIMTAINPGSVTQFTTAAWQSTGGVTLQGNNSVAQRLTVNDVFTNALQCLTVTNCWGYNITVNVNTVRQTYTQWELEWATTTGGGCQNCTINSVNMVQGFESFAASGTQFINPVANNAAFSLNDAGGWTISGGTVSVNTGAGPIAGGWTPGAGLVQITTHTGTDQVGPGGTISNTTFTETGYLDDHNNVEVGVIISSTNPNITISGGSYSAPAYTATPGPGGSPTTVGPMGINSQGLGTTVTGFTATGHPINGAPAQGAANVSIWGGGGSVVNTSTYCTVYPAGAVGSGNTVSCP